MPIQKQGSNGTTSNGMWDTDPGSTDLVESLEQQLASLYAEREHLAREIGITDADEIIALVRSSSSLSDGSPDGTESLIQQLHTLYADKDLLRQHLGTAEPDEVIDLFRRSLSLDAATSLTDQLTSLYGEREVLLAALGTSDANEIVAKFRALEGRLDVILALIDNLNTLLKEKR